MDPPPAPIEPAEIDPAATSPPDPIDPPAAADLMDIDEPPPPAGGELETVHMDDISEIPEDHPEETQGVAPTMFNMSRKA